jgi:hypothetical protein
MNMAVQNWLTNEEVTRNSYGYKSKIDSKINPLSYLLRPSKYNHQIQQRNNQNQFNNQQSGNNQLS